MNIHLTGCATLAAFAIPAAYAQESLPPEVCSAFELYIALPASVVPVMQGVKDRQTADAAAEALHQLMPRVYETRDAVEKIPQLSPAATQELERRYGRKAQTAWGPVYQEIFRLQKNQCFGSTALAREFNILCMLLK